MIIAFITAQSSCFAAKNNNDPSNDPDLVVAKEVTQYCDKVYTLYNGMPESDFLANFTNLPGWMDYDRHPISQSSKKYAFDFSYYSLTRTRNGITEHITFSIVNDTVSIPNITITTKSDNQYTKNRTYIVKAYTKMLGLPKFKTSSRNGFHYSYLWKKDGNVILMTTQSIPYYKTIDPNSPYYFHIVIFTGAPEKEIQKMENDLFG